MLDLQVTPGEVRAGETVDLRVDLVNSGPAPCWLVALELRVPSALSLLAGDEQVEVDRLAPGEAVTTRLKLRAREVGEWPLEVLELTYHDQAGSIHRVEDLRRTVRVLPAVTREVAPAPSLRVELISPVVPLGEWASLEGRVVHCAGAAVRRLALTTSGPVTVDGDPPWHAEGELTAGQAVRFHVRVHCAEPGEGVPLHYSLAYRDAEGREGTVPGTLGLRVGSAPQEVPSDGERISILLVTANADGQLKTEQEHGELDDVLAESGHGDRFTLVACPAAQPRRLLRKLHAVRPRIVHFAGHGTRNALVLMDDVTGTALLPSAVIEELFRLLDEHVECVVLNACYSEGTALRIARHIPFVIGMNDAIHDTAARGFAVGFYEALAAGRPIDKAFEFGRVRIGLERQPGMSTPVLFRNGRQVEDEAIGLTRATRSPWRGGTTHDQIQAD